MKKDNHLYGPDGPGVEPTLLLRYLIEKAEELFEKRYAGFPLSFRALGVSVLPPSRNSTKNLWKSFHHPTNQ